MSRGLSILLAVAVGVASAVLTLFLTLTLAIALDGYREREAQQEVAMGPSNVELQAAWQSALFRASKVGHVEMDWTPDNIKVVHVNSKHPEVYGLYIYYTDLLSTGPVWHEQILIFIPMDVRQGNALHNVLVHEFLHAIQNRMQILDPNIGNIDPEQFICEAGCCNDAEHDPFADPRW